MKQTNTYTFNMKRQTRTGVFETNSSSEHSLAIVAHDDYERWKKGELVARSTGRKESPDPCGNFWSYIHNIEFAPAEQKDELNLKFIQDNYMHFINPANWRAFKTPEQLIEMYKRGEMNGDMELYIDYKSFEKTGFDGEPYCEHFSHNVPNGLKIFGTYYHT